MDNPPIESSNILDQYKFIQTMIGAIASIIGGFFAVIIRSRVEKKQQLDYLKISLADELHDIVSIIEKMSETFTKTDNIHNDYINSLTANAESFNATKQKLFIIEKEDLRRDIIGFYKKLSETNKDSINKVGSLAEESKINPNNEIIRKFEALSATATAIKQKIKAYKYCAFWVI